ncbi:cell division protein [Paralysiella testudinis]|uniref:Cell division protein n=1 Tax=Paralysiella testudinis TaxID=2809020 RepID=A0A892ZHM0_9NEIS|nr:cell division protein [Paralysiella testudinis]QRQ82432.1 cell division protein [Paralysiella testudinis]
MKWLFAILVALNIIVFGNVVASKLMRPPHATAQVEAPATALTPTPAASVTEPVVTINPPEPASAVAPPPETKTRAELRAEAAAKARAEAAAKARAETQTQTTPSSPAAPAINCSATAVLPEDDYHRIKGLLSRWPHAASRFVEQGGSPPAKATSSRVRYMVAIDGGADMRARLKEQGFDTAISNGRLSLGVFNRRNDAEALLARAKINGFSQAEITQLGGTTATEAPAAALSVAKMRITFIQVDDQAAQDINQIIQRYGRLQRGTCKK